MPADAILDRCLSVRQLARRWAVSPRKVRDLIRRHNSWPLTWASAGVSSESHQKPLPRRSTDWPCCPKCGHGGGRLSIRKWQHY